MCAYFFFRLEFHDPPPQRVLTYLPPSLWTIKKSKGWSRISSQPLRPPMLSLQVGGNSLFLLVFAGCFTHCVVDGVLPFAAAACTNEAIKLLTLFSRTINDFSLMVPLDSCVTSVQTLDRWMVPCRVSLTASLLNVCGGCLLTDTLVCIGCPSSG